MLDLRYQRSLRRAYANASDCPSPEVFLQASLDALPPDERRRVAEHASICPRCSAEQTLARAFDEAGDEEDANERADAAAIIARLSNPAGAADRAPADVHPFPVQRVRWLRWNPGLAAAAVAALVLVGTIAIQRSPAPRLPELPADTEVRGNQLELVAPVGEIAELPRSLQWVAVSEADRYHVQLLEVDRSVLLDTTTDGVAVNLPQDVLDRMSPAVVYEWEVAALDADGKRLAWSEATSFRARPPAEE